MIEVDKLFNNINRETMCPSFAYVFYKLLRFLTSRF